MKFYRQGRKEGDFDAGIEMALSAMLVNPQFLFRVEQEPKDLAPKTAYRVSDIDLASRLSFFLWSSIPDDELLDLAVRNELHKPDVFEKQVRRMLADERSRNLATNFAAQWLHLRNLESITPDLRLFPDFDDNLRQGVPPGNGTVRRERVPRRPQRTRPAPGGLHVPQRAPRQALRHSPRLRQSLPPRRTRSPTGNGAACCGRGAF